MRIFRSGVAGVILLLVGAAAPAGAQLQQGVHVDPGSPAGKQYAFPVTSARSEGAGGGAASNSANPPLFGSGITPSSGSGADGSSSVTVHGQHSTRSGRGVSGSGLARTALSGSGATETPAAASALAASSPTGTRTSTGGGTGWLALAGGGALVLLLGGGGGIALRRRLTVD